MIKIKLMRDSFTPIYEFEVNQQFEDGDFDLIIKHEDKYFVYFDTESSIYEEDHITTLTYMETLMQTVEQLKALNFK